MSTITVEEAKKIIEQKHPIIVDIRDPASYAAGKIAGAVHVGDSNVDEFVAGADKTRPLIVYCFHGNTSQGAADYFLSKGFKEAYSIEGGFESWED